jgi:hypothetical protein
MTANNIASSHPKVTVPGNPVRWHILGGLLLITAIAIGTAITVSSFRERGLNSSGRELENTTLLLARHFDQQLNEFGVIQRELVAASLAWWHSRCCGHDGSFRRSICGCLW